MNRSLPRTAKFLTAMLATAIAGNAIAQSAFQTDIAVTARISRKLAQDTNVRQAAYVLAALATPDTDGYALPPKPTSGTTLTGGGLVPTSSGAPTTDGFGVKLGYCAWDNGTNTSNSGYIAGTNSISAVTLAVVSPGADNQFSTTCAQIAAGQPAQGDDFYVAYTGAQILSGVQGTTYFADPVNAVTDFASIAPAALKDGQVRLVKSTNALYRYNSGTGWTPVIAPWQSGATSGDLYYTAGNVSIGTATPTRSLTVQSAGVPIGLASTGSRTGVDMQNASTAAVNAFFGYDSGVNQSVIQSNAAGSSIALTTGGGSVTVNSAGVLSAPQGVTTTTLTASNIQSSGPMTVTGLLTANGGLQSTAGSFSGNLTGTTASFSGLVAHNGGLTSTTGAFSGVLQANGGLQATTGSFSGALAANGGLVATTGAFGGLLQANAGLQATTGTFTGALTGNTASFSGIVQANGGLTASTGTFSGLLTANGGLQATTGNFTGALTGTTAVFTAPGVGNAISALSGNASNGTAISIGRTASEAQIAIAANNGDWLPGTVAGDLAIKTTSSTGKIVFGRGAAGTTTMTLDGTGNVGIGTTTPAAKLDVAGTANFSGLVSANGGLSATTGNFTGALTGTTATFSGLVAHNGGLTSTTGSFSGVLQANGGLQATTGNFTGALTGTSATLSGQLQAATGYYTQSVGIGTAPQTLSGSGGFPLTIASPNFVGIFNSINSSSTNVSSGNGAGLYLQNLNSTPGNYQAIEFVDAGGRFQGSMGMMYGAHTGQSQGTFYIEPRIVTTPSAFVVAPSGNVGIGVTVPSATLQVAGGSVTAANQQPTVARLSILGGNGGYTGNGASLMLDAWTNKGGANSQPVAGVSASLGNGGGGGNDYSGSLSFSTKGQGDTAPVQRMLIDPNGNVGISIGGDPLGARLQVGSSTDAKNVIGINGNATSYTAFVANSSNGSAISVFSNASGSVDGFGMPTDTVGIASFNSRPLVFGVNQVERMRLDSSGRLGIGTTAPITQLHVIGDISAYNGTNSIGAGGALNFGIGTSSGSPMSQIKGLLNYAPDGTELQGGIGFSTRPVGSVGQVMTERMRITNDGNIGIGTATPGAKLDVRGTTNISIAGAAAGSSYDTGQILGIQNLVHTADTRVLSFGGFDDGAGYIRNPANTAIGIAVGNVERARFDNQGRFGIGTNAPNEMLTVAGNGNFGGQVTAGGASMGYQFLAANASSAAYYKIATLPASSAGTYDHINIEAVVNPNWGSSANTVLRVVMANRNGLVARQTVEGNAAPTNARIQAFTESDGSVSIYAYLAASSYNTVSLQVKSSINVTLYRSPAAQSSVTGTGSFDSSTATPAYMSDASYNFSVGGNTNSNYRLQVTDSQANGVQMGVVNTASNAASLALIANGTSGYGVSGWASAAVLESNSSATGGLVLSSYSGPLIVQTNGRQERLRVDASGNVGIGNIAPAWNSAYRALSIGSSGQGVLYGSTNGTGFGTSAGQVGLWQNSYYNSSSQSIAVGTGGGSGYIQGGGYHLWYSMPSVNAGSVQTINQTMTLDVNGKLGIGNTAPDSLLTVGPVGTQGAANAPSLHVAGGYNSVEGAWLSAGGNGHAYLDLNSHSASTTAASWRLAHDSDASGTTLMWRYAAPATTRSGLSYANKLQLGANGDLGLYGNMTMSGAVTAINGYFPTNGAIRLTPNLHLNAGSNNTGYAVIVNWDNGANSGKQFRVGNGNAADAAYINGDGSAWFGGNISATGFTTSSDRRFKTNIQSLSADSLMAKFMLVRPVEYNLIATGARNTGYIAQEIQELFPDMVSVIDKEGHLGVTYTQMIPIIHSVVQKQQKQIQDLQEKKLDNATGQWIASADKKERLYFEAGGKTVLRGHGDIALEIHNAEDSPIASFMRNGDMNVAGIMNFTGATRGGFAFNPTGTIVSSLTPGEIVVSSSKTLRAAVRLQHADPSSQLAAGVVYGMLFGDETGVGLANGAGKAMLTASTDSAGGVTVSVAGQLVVGDSAKSVIRMAGGNVLTATADGALQLEGEQGVRIYNTKTKETVISLGSDGAVKAKRFVPTDVVEANTGCDGQVGAIARDTNGQPMVCAK